MWQWKPAIELGQVLFGKSLWFSKCSLLLYGIFYFYKTVPISLERLFLLWNICKLTCSLEFSHVHWSTSRESADTTATRTPLYKRLVLAEFHLFDCDWTLLKADTSLRRTAIGLKAMSIRKSSLYIAFVFSEKARLHRRFLSPFPVQLLSHPNSERKSQV